MKTFEPITVDEKINKALIKAFKNVTFNNYQLSKVNYYTYYCKNVNITSNVTRYYLYLLLNEFTRSMYLGITNNIKDRLVSHARDQVLGPNDNVALNALFIVELEEILGKKEIFSPEGQIKAIEQKLTNSLRNLGYDVRCRYNEMEDKVESGLIEVYFLESLNNKLIRQKVKEELYIIDHSLESFLRIIAEGGYYYYSFRDGEVYHELTTDELASLRTDTESCKVLLTKDKSEYKKSDWEFIRKCLFHKGLRISLWEQGIGDIDEMIVLKRELSPKDRDNFGVI